MSWKGLCPSRDSILTKRAKCYKITITVITKDGDKVLWKIDFSSDEALYLQLCNQIIMDIAAEVLRDGDSLPSVRQLADNIGINMHTVNKAYTVLKQEGFVKLDRRKGAFICLDMDKMQALEEMRQDLEVVLARGICRDVTREEAHRLLDQVFDAYTKR